MHTTRHLGNVATGNRRFPDPARIAPSDFMGQLRNWQYLMPRAILFTSPAHAQRNENCTVSVLNRTAQVKTTNMLLRPLAMIAVLMIDTGAVTAAEPNYVLDAAKLPVPKYPDTVPRWGVVGGAGSTVFGLAADEPPRHPLKVTLERVDKSTYGTGELLTFTVLLENVGNDTIPLPWTRDWRLAEAGGPEDHIELVVSVNPTIPGFETPYFPVVALYGASSLNETVRLLMPGQSARLIVPTTIRLEDRKSREAVKSDLLPEVSLRARVRFPHGARDIAYALVDSENELKIKIRDKK